MPRPHRHHPALSACLVVLAALTLTGCSVLFVPRKPDPTPTPTPIPVVHQFIDLEARLPDEIGGQAVQKFSLRTDPSAQLPKTLEVLRRLGKTSADVEVAKGFLSGSDFNLSALRIVGADAIQAAVAFEQIDEGDPHPTTTYQPATVGGKRVLIRTNGEAVDYMYPLGDVIFVVGGSRPLVEEALSKIK